MTPGPGPMTSKHRPTPSGSKSCYRLRLVPTEARCASVPRAFPDDYRGRQATEAGPRGNESGLDTVLLDSTEAYTPETADMLVNRASKALKNARKILDNARTRQAETTPVPSSIPNFPPSSFTFGAPLRDQTPPTPPTQTPGLTPDSSFGSSASSASPSSSSRERSTIFRDERGPSTSRWGAGGYGGANGDGGGPYGDGGAMPELLLQRQRTMETAVRAYMEAEPGAELIMRSEEAMMAAAAKNATLPPLQSILELTTAHVAPQRQGQGGVADASFRESSVAGHLLKDGTGVLADGSTFERLSGEEMGDNGFWCRWWVLRGTSAAGTVEWEERWWEASDWSGMREMGAEKSGWNARGDAWREYWKEKIYYRGESGEPCVERDAHKWAHNEGGEEWEEKWGEFYTAGGHINKWADKWGKAGDEVWHEKWGEEYWNGRSCVKYTDRWAEHMLPDGRQESHGDKWTERFGDGKGSKEGANWYVNADGHRYHRAWGENHLGDGWVQKYGNSTTGDHWDTTEQTGTYYNPIAHFTFKMALDHSPTLLNVPVRPREASEEDLLEGGLSSF